MNSIKKYILSGVLMSSLVAPAFVGKLAHADGQQPPPPADQDQNGPPPPDGQNGPPPVGDQGDRQGGPRGRDGHQGGDRQGGPMRPGGRQPGMPGGGGGGGGDQNPFERMRGYLDLVDRYSRLARDPAASGVAAVVAAGDILRPRGADAAIQFYTKSLDTVKNDTVKRAIRLQLIDLYRQSGQNEKALEQLTSLMNDAPAGDPQMK